ncbi:MAG: C4-dicarboxylate transporter DctA, partial [Stellaceae bacterium]
GLALLLGVERFMSEIRAVTNLFSNIFATVVIARWMGELDTDRFEAVLDGDPDADLDTDLGIEAGEEPAFAREAE